MAELLVHLNGVLVPADQARVSVWDAGFLHGASAFTTMLAHNGKVFRLERHLGRLLETVELLKLHTSATAGSLTAACDELLAANELTRARMRITLTPGSIQAQEPTTLITASPLGEYPQEWYAKGIGVVVCALKQASGDPAYGYKTGCYLARMLARQEAAVKGAEEALWYTADNRLAEACFCNVFLVLDGTVLTPPRDTPVLPGIVRQAVGELCRGLEIPFDDQRPLTVREMLAAQEMFVTSSTAGIRPVVRVEQHAVGEEKPGAVTQRLMAVYQQLLERECSGR